MPSRLSIFSSRLFGSALIWAVSAAALIEWRAQDALPAQCANHEVDQLLDDLDHGRIPGRDTVLLGDSVGRQVGRALLKADKDAFVPLASNAAIETPGQFFMFRRYLEHHAPPKRVILMMGYPAQGQLQGDFTENYFQRGFLRWREIAEIAHAKQSLPFSLAMIGYKLFPTFRYRHALQRKCPLLERPDPPSPPPAVHARPAKPKAASKHGLLDAVANWRKAHRPGPQIAETYFLRLAALLEELGVEWIYVPLPVPESDTRMIAPDGAFGQQVRWMETHSAQFPSLRVATGFQTYPDEWFSDGTHFHEERLPLVAADYARILGAIGFP